MLSLSARTRVYLAPGATDMRKSFDTLCGVVREILKEEPLTGHLFAFTNRARTRLKVLYWDGSGLWVMAKRLEKGTFFWPRLPSDDTSSITLSHAEFSLLLAGIDLSATKPRRWYRRDPRPV